MCSRKRQQFLLITVKALFSPSSEPPPPLFLAQKFNKPGVNRVFTVFTVFTVVGISGVAWIFLTE